MKENKPNIKLWIWMSIIATIFTGMTIGLAPLSLSILASCFEEEKEQNKIQKLKPWIIGLLLFSLLVFLILFVFLIFGKEV